MAKKKGRRRARVRRRLFVALLCLALIAVGAYFTTRYIEHRQYLIYPLHYKELIVREAGDNELEPWYVAAVICCESSFREAATSSVGARGLMQIMPDTGRWLSGKLNQSEEYTDDLLYQAEHNVEYGCWYLHWLSERYDGSLACVTAAYHAGHGQVDAWLADSGQTELEFSAESIPSAATAQYVKRVLNARERYKELYDFEV